MQVTLLEDQDHFYVSAQIDGEHFDLCRFTDIALAAEFMNKWTYNRGLVWAPDSARRVDAVIRSQGPVLVLDAIPGPPRLPMIVVTDE